MRICINVVLYIFFSISNNVIHETITYLKFALSVYTTNGRITQYRLNRFRLFLLERIHFKGSLMRGWLGSDYGIWLKLIFFVKNSIMEFQILVNNKNSVFL